MLELNQYVDLDGNIITLPSDIELGIPDILQESESEDGEWAGRYWVGGEETVWLNEDGHEIADVL